MVGKCKSFTGTQATSIQEILFSATLRCSFEKQSFGLCLDASSLVRRPMQFADSSYHANPACPLHPPTLCFSSHPSWSLSLCCPVQAPALRSPSPGASRLLLLGSPGPRAPGPCASWGCCMGARTLAAPVCPSPFSCHFQGRVGSRLMLWPLPPFPLHQCLSSLLSQGPCGVGVWEACHPHRGGRRWLAPFRGTSGVLTSTPA